MYKHISSEQKEIDQSQLIQLNRLRGFINCEIINVKQMQLLNSDGLYTVREFCREPRQVIPEKEVYCYDALMYFDGKIYHRLRIQSTANHLCGDTTYEHSLLLHCVFAKTAAIRNLQVIGLYQAAIVVIDHDISLPELKRYSK